MFERFRFIRPFILPDLSPDLSPKREEGPIPERLTFHTTRPIPRPGLSPKREQRTITPFCLIRP